jgi:hypothetical protein
MKPTPFQIISYHQADSNNGEHQADVKEIGTHEHERLLMQHAPELLHELKTALGLLLQVLDHHREGKPLPAKSVVRHVALDALNVIDSAEGRRTEGTCFYPLSESS